MHFAWVALSAWVAGAAAGPTPPEKHVFHVKADVSYRCYGGYGEKKGQDSRTHVVCDNQTYKKTLLDETVSIGIEDAPDPEGSQDLEGAWEKTVEFRGRKFTVALSLFKTVPSHGSRPYQLRAVAADDEPTTRSSAVYESAERVVALSPLSLEESSRGQPEEIQLRVEITPRASP